MKDREQLLREESPMKLLIKFSIPAILGMLVNALYNIVDRIFIGNIPEIGDLAITGVGITFPIMNLILGMAMLIGVGAGAKISIELGAGNKKGAETTLDTAMILQFIIAAAIAIVSLIFLTPMLRMFGASENTLGYAKDYIIIILLGSIFNIASFVLTSTIRAEGNPKLSSIIIGISAAANVILDPIFIFVFNMGVQGAAIATVISQAIGTVVAFMYYHNPQGIRIFNYKSGPSVLKVNIKKAKLKKEYVMPILAIGTAPFLMQVAASAVSIVANRVLFEYGGDLAIGAMAIINSIVLMCLMPIFGINQGSQPIIGYNYGAKRFDRVKKTIIYATILGTIFSTIGWVISMCFTKYLVMAFNRDPNLLEMSTIGMRIWSMGLFCVGFQIVASNYFQAIGKAKLAVILSLLRQVIILIPALIILPVFFELNGIWLAAPISDIVSTIVTGIAFIFEIRYLNALIKEQVN